MKMIMGIPNPNKNIPLIKDFLRSAPAIAFDGCHKIYIALDDQQVRRFEDYGYNEDISSMIYAHDASREDMLAKLVEWYDNSCSLRFIEAVRTVRGDPNDGFISVISQFEGDEDENA